MYVAGSAIITGANGGIGRAIAERLSDSNMDVVLVVRDSAKLEYTGIRDDIGRDSNVSILEMDFEDNESLEHGIERLNSISSVRFLIHCAGYYTSGLVADVPVSELDRSYAVNVRAPYLITQAVLPQLVDASGCVVFVNSSVVPSGARHGLSHYSMTKTAQKILADSLRVELGGTDARVTTLYLGKTDTRMQQEACRSTNMPYKPSRMLRPDSVATLVQAILELDRTSEITDVSIRPASPYG